MNTSQCTLLASLLLGSATAGAAGEVATRPCEPRKLGFDQKAAGWTHLPLSKLKRDTVYTLVADGGRAACCAPARTDRLRSTWPR